MGTEIIKWGGGHKLSSPRPEAVLGRGKMWINIQPRIQEDDSSVSVYLKIIRMKRSKRTPKFPIGLFLRHKSRKWARRVQQYSGAFSFTSSLNPQNQLQKLTNEKNASWVCMQGHTARASQRPAGFQPFLPLASFLSLQRSPCDGCTITDDTGLYSKQIQNTDWKLKGGKN